MVNTISTHLNEHEEVPVFLHDPLFDELKTLLGHGINLAQQVFLIFCAEIRHIHQVFTKDSFNFFHYRGGIRIRSIRILRRGREKATYLDDIDGLWWIRLRHANSDHTLYRTRENVPNAISLH